MVSLELLNGVRSGNRFEKRILTGKWKRPHIAIKRRAGGFADHTILSTGRVQRDYCDRELSYYVCL